MDWSKKIIIALDVENRGLAVALIKELKAAQTFKVGMELFTAEGPGLLREIQEMEKKVFLDLKFHDIPNTVGGAVRMATRHGVQMLTIHTSGGKEMIACAAAAAAEEAEQRKIARPLLLGVTILTSFKSEQLIEIGVSDNLVDQVLRLAQLARQAGLDGIVCSPQEIEMIRKEMGKEFLVVTPGIRPSWAASQDQKRIMTPAEAIRKGSDYLVIGRPITASPSPQEAFLRIVQELESSGHSPHGKNRA